MFIAPHGAHLILAELLEFPAVAYVMGVPSVEEAVWLAGVTEVIFDLARELMLRFCCEDRRLFTLVVLCLGLGV